MTNAVVADRSKKITISLPASLLATIDDLVREQHSNRSAVIAELIRKVAQERFEAEMREGYLENAEEAKQIAEEFFSVLNETWPEWESDEEEEKK